MTLKENKIFVSINICFSLLFFSLLFIQGCDISYLSYHHDFINQTSRDGLITIIIIFKIILISVFLIYSICHLLLLKKEYLIKLLSIISLVILTTICLLEILHISLLINQYVYFKDNSTLYLYNNLYLITLVFSLCFLVYSVTFYFLRIRKYNFTYNDYDITSKQDDSSNEKNDLENDSIDLPKFNSKREIFLYVKQLHEDKKISDETYTKLLSEFIDDDIENKR